MTDVRKGDDDFLSVCIQQETLPGFKWIGNRIHELTQTGNTVLFSFEESIGNKFIVFLGCLLADRYLEYF